LGQRLNLNQGSIRQLTYLTADAADSGPADSLHAAGLKNFYMAGHWVVAGGGLPSAALSGRYAAQMICAQNGIKFAPAAP
jgi:phytoene dehydrogenase-like protein